MKNQTKTTTLAVQELICYNTNTGWSLMETTKINHKHKLSRKKTKNKKAGKNTPRKKQSKEGQKTPGKQIYQRQWTDRKWK